MITLIRTNSENKDFQKLVVELDNDLAERNGTANGFFARFNKIDLIKHAVIAMDDGQPVGCGAIKEYTATVMEVKRMYVRPGMRGKGVAVAVLRELEDWAIALGYKKCILETGTKMPEAIGLYKKSGYAIIPNYGPYAAIESSICFAKDL